MIHSLILFAHIVGVLGLFIALAFEWLGVESLRRSSDRLTRVAVAVIVASGLYLGARIGVLGNIWMRASYAAMVLMALVGGVTARLSARAAAPEAMLRASLYVRIAFGLAVVYLMIAKPA